MLRHIALSSLECRRGEREWRLCPSHWRITVQGFNHEEADLVSLNRAFDSGKTATSPYEKRYAQK